MNRKSGRVVAHSALMTVMESPFIAAAVVVPLVLIVGVSWLLGGAVWAASAVMVLAIAAAVGLKLS